jgi:hypothetical protein
VHRVWGGIWVLPSVLVNMVISSLLNLALVIMLQVQRVRK